MIASAAPIQSQLFCSLFDCIVFFIYPRLELTARFFFNRCCVAQYREVQTERNECKSALKKAEDRISTLESSLVNRTRIAKEADAAAQEAVGKYDAMADEIEQQQATIEKLEAALANATAMAEAQSEAAGEHAATAKLWTEKHADLEESHLALQDLHRQLHDEVTGLNSFWKLKWKWDTEL